MSSQSLVVSSLRHLLVRCFAIIDLFILILIVTERRFLSHNLLMVSHRMIQTLLVIFLCTKVNHTLLMLELLVWQLRLINGTLSIADDF